MISNSANRDDNNYDVLDEELEFSDRDGSLADLGEESDPLASDSSSQDEEHDEVFGASIDEILAGAKWAGRRKRRGFKGVGPRRRRKSDIPTHLNNQMGTATMAYVAKDYEKAEKILNHIITVAPNAAAPYRTLALIYEERHERKKALDAYMTAAEIDKQDPDLWKRNSALWLEHNNIENAIYCLTMAIKASQIPDPEALRARGDLYIQRKKYKMAADNYSKLSKVLPYDIEVARLIIGAFRKAFAEERAYEPIEQMMRACELRLYSRQRKDKERVTDLEAVIDEIVQMLVYIRLSQKRYHDANLLLTRIQHRGAATGRPLTFVQRLMMAICQHRLGSIALATPTLLEFLASPSMTDKHRRLLAEVAEACKDGADYAKAIRSYALLLELDEEGTKVEFYMSRALCYKEIGNSRAAQEDLQSVMLINPKHLEASLLLQEYLLPDNNFDPVSGRRKKARKKGEPLAFSIKQRQAFYQSDRDSAMQVLMVADKLFDQGDYEGYLSRVYTALKAALQLKEPTGSSQEEIDGSSDTEKGQDNLDKVTISDEMQLQDKFHNERQRNKSKWNEANLSESEKSSLQVIGACIMRTIDEDPYVDVASRIVTSFYHVGRMEMAQPITKLFYSINHIRVRTKESRNKLRRLDMVASCAAGNIAKGYEQARCLLLECPEDPMIVYSYFLIENMWTRDSDAQRANSFRCVTRLGKKHPQSVYLAMVSGACSSRGGLNIRTYTTGIYLHAFKLVRHHPLVALCLAIQMTYVAMSRRVPNRNEAVTYALAFLDDYRHNRMEHAEEGEEVWRQMEVDYNAGRLLHQLGLLHMAVDMYHRVLQAKVDEKDLPKWADVRMEAAYNLIQIYRISGSDELAAAICQKYLQF